ncbi:glycoside hydrolase family 2 protein [Humibacter ginsengisoli]
MASEPAGAGAREPDLLRDAVWKFASCRPGEISSPEQAMDLQWAQAPVPGTVASALLQAGRRWDEADIDGLDWWYQTGFPARAGERAELVLEGLAVSAEVWLNGGLVASTADMFVTDRVRLEGLAEQNRLAIRFRSLSAELSGRRPRPRWRVARLADGNLRWTRASLLGRLKGAVPVPPIVGPWRPVRLVPVAEVRITRRRLVAVPTGDGSGVLDAQLELRGDIEEADLAAARLRVAGSDAPVAAEFDAESATWSVRASVSLDDVRLWWPHSLGEQRLYEVELSLGARQLSVGRVGFRTIVVDESDGGFRFVVNGVPIFVGGSCWMPLDPIGLREDRESLRAAIQQVVDGNQRMLRVSGDTVYECDAFYELCDELGVMVWQDCMLAFADPPDDLEWECLFLREVRQNLDRLSGHPSIALVSGGSEIAQQAAYAGVALDAGLPLLTERLPVVVKECLGKVPFLPTSPWGGDVPTRPDSGVSHYYGVGAYLRAPEDARLARPRFAAECLAFAIPPGRQTVERYFGNAAAAGHAPEWKRAVFRDAGASWDFEDVRDHYVRELFGVEPLTVRYADPDRYLDLGRAAVAHLVGRTFAEWRRTESPSSGGLVFYLRDSLPGAGMGLIDSTGLPKEAWHAMRRALAPVAVSLSDEGLNGLVAHVHNDTPTAMDATLRVELFVDGELMVDSAERSLSIPPRSSAEVGVDALFDGFRDLSWAHRFGPIAHDVISATLLDEAGHVIGRTCQLPGGLGRPLERDLGLAVEVRRADESSAELEVSSRRFAQFVTVAVPGWIADDTAFELAPGSTALVRLRPIERGARLVGTVRALNGNQLAFREVRG